MDETKSAVTSLGIVGPAIALVTVVSQQYLGVDISDLTSVLPGAISKAVDDAMVIGGLVMGIYGRWRASSRISGIFVK